MSINKRLFILVFLPILVLLVVMVSNFNDMHRLEGVQQNFLENDYSSTVLLEEARAAMWKMRKATMEYRLGKYESGHASSKSDFENSYASLQKALSDFKPLINGDGNDQSHWETETSLAKEYHAIALSQMEKFDAGDYQSVSAIGQQLKETGDKLRASLLDHIEYQKKQMEEDVTQVKADNGRSRIVSISIAIISVASLAVLGIVAARSIIRPLSELTDGMQHVESNLDFTKSIPERNNNDEVSRAVIRFNALIKRLRESLGVVSNQGAGLAVLSKSLTNAAGNASANATQQNSYASSIAAAIEQLTVSINHISNQTASLREKGKNAFTEAESGSAVIESTVNSIQAIASTTQKTSIALQELAQSTSSITATVGLIKDIADQTNLLALNAAIEAARAGEQGRGFAVVADEVRKLAERTAHLTGEIDGLTKEIERTSQASIISMNEMRLQVQSGVEMAGNASDAMTRISEESHQSLTMVNDIASAIQEQSVASNQIALNIERISQMSEEASADAEKGFQLAVEIKNSSDTLLQSASVYKL